MTKRNASYAGIVTGWAMLSASLAVNADELPHLEAHRQLLEGLLEEAHSLTSEQALRAAEKQDATKRLQDVLDQGQKLATFLRTGVRQHFGNRSEKLVEFGMQPFRSRPKPAEPVIPPRETPAPEMIE